MDAGHLHGRRRISGNFERIQSLVHEDRVTFSRLMEILTNATIDYFPHKLTLVLMLSRYSTHGALLLPGVTMNFFHSSGSVESFRDWRVGYQ